MIPRHTVAVIGGIVRKLTTTPMVSNGTSGDKSGRIPNSGVGDIGRSPDTRVQASSLSVLREPEILQLVSILFKDRFETIFTAA